MTGEEYAAISRKSEGEARRTVFDEYYSYVNAILYGRIGGCASREDIEECAADVFSEVFKVIDSGRYSGELKGIISTVAKRRAIDRYRTLAKQSPVFSLDDSMNEQLDPGADVQSACEREQMSKIIMEKILALGEIDSTIIIQKYYYNRTSHEIAKNLSMKPSAVRMRCKRALAQLKSELQRDGITFLEV